MVRADLCLDVACVSSVLYLSLSIKLLKPVVAGTSPNTPLCCGHLKDLQVIFTRAVYATKVSPFFLNDGIYFFSVRLKPICCNLIFPKMDLAAL